MSINTATYAMRDGEGAEFLAALEGMRGKELSEALKKLGGRADDSRWDVRIGRSLLDACEFLLAQPMDNVRRFLPTLAIAAVREHQYQSAKKRERGEVVLAKLRPFIEEDEDAADLVARSGCHSLRLGLEGAPDFYELVRQCPGIRKNTYFIELEKSVKKKSAKKISAKSKSKSKSKSK